MNFEDARHLENHKKVHGRKSKVSEYGNSEFNIDRLRDKDRRKRRIISKVIVLHKS